MMDHTTVDRIEQWSADVSRSIPVSSNKINNMCRLMSRKDILAMVCFKCRDVVLIVDESEATHLFENIDARSCANRLWGTFVITLCNRDKDQSAMSNAAFEATPSECIDVVETWQEFIDVAKITTSCTCMPLPSDRSRIMTASLDQFKGKFRHARMVRSLYADGDVSKFG